MQWSRETHAVGYTFVVVTALVNGWGCQSVKPTVARSQQPLPTKPSNTVVTPVPSPIAASPEQSPVTSVRHAAHFQEPSIVAPSPATQVGDPESPSAEAVPALETLEDLEAWAANHNPTLRRLQQEAAAEWAKTDYVSKLPDPTVGTMFYSPPMNFQPDRQLGEVQVALMIPWLGRLKAEARRVVGQDRTSPAAIGQHSNGQRQAGGD